MKPPSLLQYRGYTVFAASGISTEKSRMLVDNALDLTIAPRHIFKDNHRTYSAVFDVGGEAAMLKIPRGRNQRKWERLLTLFRGSEGVRTFRNLELMQRLGFGAPYPLLAAEKRKHGFVVDSFTYYAFEEGRPAESGDAEAVMSELLHLHDTGHLRTDPQPANFLVTDRGIVFIDFRLKKPFLLAGLKKKLELAKLVRVYPESAPHIPKGLISSPSFSLAKWLDMRIYNLRQGKRKLKSGLK